MKRGLYTSDYTSKVKLEGMKVRDPLDVNPWIAQRATRLALEFKSQPITALKGLYEDIRIGGRLGIKFDSGSESGRGCHTAVNVLDTRKGCCLELTFLYLAICKKAGLNDIHTSALGFNVYRFVSDSEGFHACGGILLPNVPPDLKHTRFASDRAFRRLVLETAGRADENLDLLLLEFTVPSFGYQHTVLDPMNDVDLIANILNNDGVYASLHLSVPVRSKAAVYLESSRLGNLLAESNLITMTALVAGEEMAVPRIRTSLPNLITTGACEGACVSFMKADDPEGLVLTAYRFLQLSPDHPRALFYLSMGRFREGDVKGSVEIGLLAYEAATAELLSKKPDHNAETEFNNRETIFQWLVSSLFTLFHIDKTDLIEGYLESNRKLVASGYLNFIVGRYGKRLVTVKGAPIHPIAFIDLFSHYLAKDKNKEARELLADAPELDSGLRKLLGVQILLSEKKLALAGFELTAFLRMPRSEFIEHSESIGFVFDKENSSERLHVLRYLGRTVVLADIFISESIVSSFVFVSGSEIAPGKLNSLRAITQSKHSRDKALALVDNLASSETNNSGLLAGSVQLKYVLGDLEGGKSDISRILEKEPEAKEVFEPKLSSWNSFLSLLKLR